MHRFHVTWFLRADIKLASARLQGYLIHQELRRRGYASELFAAPPFSVRKIPLSPESMTLLAETIDSPVVVFQKIVDPRAERMIVRLRQRGIKTIYVQCDYRPENTLPLVCDYVVVPSPFLHDYYVRLGKQCVLIHDPIEHLISQARLIRRHRARAGAENIRLVWVGNKANWHTLKSLREILAQKEYEDYELITISNHPDANVPWQLRTAHQHILKGDIGVVPTNQDWDAQAKSHNRATLFMGLGLPVVAGDIPAYREVITDGQTGFICDTPEQWEDALDALRNPERRLHIALRAHEEAAASFSLDAATDQWLDLLGEASSTATVSVGGSPQQRMGLRSKLGLEAYLRYARAALKKGDRWSALQMILRAMSLLPQATQHTLTHATPKDSSPKVPVG